jgi:predicted lipoprotein with Yx(FWY)xxD motif
VRQPTALGAAAAAAAVIAAGCGGSGSSSTKTAAASNAAQTQTGSPYGASTTSAATSSTAAAPSSAASAVLVTTKHNTLGTILAAGPKQLTVYMFEGDKGSASACSGGCTHVWPPVTTSGTATSGGSAMAGELGTITRPDGTRQVTYRGHPLYFFARDGDKGDAYGQGVVGFGASWYVLAPSGSKVDKS